MALSALAFRLPRGLDRPGQPNPNGGSQRSAGWDRAAVARAAGAEPLRGAPLSTGSPAAAGVGCAATQDPAVVPTGHRADSSGDRLRAYPPGAPSARRDSGGTIRVAVRARSTECRTGSTPGSPDQPNLGDDAGRRNTGPLPAWTANQPAMSEMGALAVRPQHEQLPMAIHSFHRFIHSNSLGIFAICTASSGRPVAGLWITPGGRGAPSTTQNDV
jgi:hypothetical protein